MGHRLLRCRAGNTPMRYPRDVLRLKTDMAARVIRPWKGAPATTTYTLVRIKGGNIVASGSGWSIPGIRFNNTAISAIYSGEVSGGQPAEVNTYQDGLAWGHIDGTTTKVYVAAKATPSGGSAQTDLVSPMVMPMDAMVWCKRSVAVPLDGDPSTTFPVWLLWRV